MLPELERVDIDMDGRFLRRDPGEVGETRPAGDHQVRFQDECQGMRRPELPVEPGNPLVLVGEDALRPEGGDDRRLDRLREVEDRTGRTHGPEPREDDRSCGAVDRLRRGRDGLVGRRNPDLREAGLALAVGCIKRFSLDIVRERELGNAAGDGSVTQRPGEEFDRRRRVGDGVVEDRDRPEEGVLVDLLDAAGPGILRLDLAIQ
ncbi:hypothetical protein DSECCO2_641330 [anaerobic digester metagenome]